MITEEQVKKANKEFYDIVGSNYEELDGRRKESLYAYLEDQLKQLSILGGTDSILDLGCGSGFVSKVADQLFRRRLAVDISYSILRGIEDQNLERIAADSDFIPIGDNQIDVVGAFALLHHCHSFERLCGEVYRILKTGGVFYSDHDMDISFYSRFKRMMKIYRRIHNAKKRYLENFDSLSENLYDCSEFHQNGIQPDLLCSLLKKTGFREVNITFHWFGLSSFSDRLFGKKIFPRGWAPLTRIVALK
jgi:SAM-dependent methyltransferase